MQRMINPRCITCPEARSLWSDINALEAADSVMIHEAADGSGIQKTGPLLHPKMCYLSF